MAHLRPRVNTGISTIPKAKLKPGDVPPPEDSYLAKVVTYIPAETIAAYQAGATAAGADAGTGLSYFALFLLIFTPLWILFATTNPGERLPWYQALVGLMAFLVWLLAVGSPFWNEWILKQQLGIADPVKEVSGIVRSLVLIAATLAFPLIERILRYFGVRI